LVYGVHINQPLLVDDLYQSIQALPKPKHYVYRGEKRSEYMTWHFCVWAKYSSEPFLSREYLDSQEQADNFFQTNKKLFDCMSGLLGPWSFQTISTISITKWIGTSVWSLVRLCGE